MEFTVTIIWFDEERLWCARCEDLKITLEYGSFDALLEQTKAAAYDMAELNLGYKGEIRLRYVIERSDVLAVS